MYDHKKSVNFSVYLKKENGDDVYKEMLVIIGGSNFGFAFNPVPDYQNSRLNIMIPSKLIFFQQKSLNNQNVFVRQCGDLSDVLILNTNKMNKQNTINDISHPVFCLKRHKCSLIN